MNSNTIIALIVFLGLITSTFVVLLVVRIKQIRFDKKMQEMLNRPYKPKILCFLEGGIASSGYKELLHLDLDVELLDPMLCGYRHCEEKIKLSDSIYFMTADPSLLHNDVWWDEIAEEWNIYVYRKGEWVNIATQTDKELRRAHNIERMWIAGGFGK